METLECVLRSSPDWGLLSCFICAQGGHKESPVTLAAATGSQPENVASDEQRDDNLGGGNFRRSLGPIVPALGWANTGSGVKTAEIIPDPISLIAEDGQSGRCS